MRRGEAALACVLLVAAATPAGAQSADAEALFREGRELLEAGEIARACEKFEASRRLEVSVGTLLNLGDCRERLGQSATARATFLEAESLARQRGDDERRAREAARRAKALEAELAYLTIDVPVDSRVEGLVITRNGEPVARALWSTPVPVDPGEHRVAADADDHEHWGADVYVAPQTRRARIVVPRLARLRWPTPAPIAGRAGSRWTGTRKVAVAIGAIGVASLGGGIAYGLRANDLADRSNDRCPSAICADPEGLRLNEDAQDAALRANIFYGAAAAALAGAVTLWVIGDPDEVAAVPVVQADHVGVSIARRF